jgi:hypothetical protein
MDTPRAVAARRDSMNKQARFGFTI